MSSNLTVAVPEAQIVRGTVTATGTYPACTVTPDSQSAQSARALGSYPTATTGDTVFCLRWDKVLYVLGKVQ